MNDRYQIIDRATGHKVNVILWDGTADLGISDAQSIEPDDGTPIWAGVSVVPQQVPMWAAQAALKQVGHYDAINAAILQMETSNAPVFFAWTMGNYASRGSAFITTLGARFGMTDPEIDAVFVVADQIAQVAG